MRYFSVLQALNVVSSTLRPCQSSYPKASLPLNNFASSGCALKGKTYHGTVNPLPTVHVMRPTLPCAKQQLNLHQYGSLSERRHLQKPPKSAQPGCSPRASLQGLPSCGGAPARPSGSRAVPLRGPSVETNGPLRLVEPRRDPAPDHRQGVSRWCLQVQTGASTAPSATFTARRPGHHPCQPMGMRAPASNNRSPAKPPGASGPCKRTQNTVEEEDDVMRRKREYWRVKKKEQRARKAARERGLAHLDMSSDWEPVLPTQNQLPHNQQSQVVFFSIPFSHLLGNVRKKLHGHLHATCHVFNGNKMPWYFWYDIVLALWTWEYCMELHISYFKLHC